MRDSACKRRGSVGEDGGEAGGSGATEPMICPQECHQIVLGWIFLLHYAIDVCQCGRKSQTIFMSTGGLGTHFGINDAHSKALQICCLVDTSMVELPVSCTILLPANVFHTPAQLFIVV